MRASVSEEVLAIGRIQSDVDGFVHQRQQGFDDFFTSFYRETVLTTLRQVSALNEEDKEEDDAAPAPRKSVRVSLPRRPSRPSARCPNGDGDDGVDAEERDRVRFRDKWKRDSGDERRVTIDGGRVSLDASIHDVPPELHSIATPIPEFEFSSPATTPLARHSRMSFFSSGLQWEDRFRSMTTFDVAGFKPMKSMELEMELQGEKTNESTEPPPDVVPDAEEESKEAPDDDRCVVQEAENGVETVAVHEETCVAEIIVQEQETAKEDPVDPKLGEGVLLEQEGSRQDPIDPGLVEVVPQAQKSVRQDPIDPGLVAIVPREQEGAKQDPPDRSVAEVVPPVQDTAEHDPVDRSQAESNPKEETPAAAVAVAPVSTIQKMKNLVNLVDAVPSRLMEITQQKNDVAPAGDRLPETGDDVTADETEKGEHQGNIASNVRTFVGLVKPPEVPKIATRHFKPEIPALKKAAQAKQAEKEREDQRKKRKEQVTLWKLQQRKQQTLPLKAGSKADGPPPGTKRQSQVEPSPNKKQRLEASRRPKKTGQATSHHHGHRTPVPCAPQRGQGGTLPSPQYDLTPVGLLLSDTRTKRKERRREKHVPSWANDMALQNDAIAQKKNMDPAAIFPHLTTLEPLRVFGTPDSMVVRDAAERTYQYTHRNPSSVNWTDSEDDIDAHV